jgi:hypothetical protein
VRRDLRGILQNNDPQTSKFFTCRGITYSLLTQSEAKRRPPIGQRMQRTRPPGCQMRGFALPSRSHPQRTRSSLSRPRNDLPNGTGTRLPSQPSPFPFGPNQPFWCPHNCSARPFVHASAPHTPPHRWPPCPPCSPALHNNTMSIHHPPSSLTVCSRTSSLSNSFCICAFSGFLLQFVVRARWW